MVWSLFTREILYSSKLEIILLKKEKKKMSLIYRQIGKRILSLKGLEKKNVHELSKQLSKNFPKFMSKSKRTKIIKYNNWNRKVSKNFTWKLSLNDFLLSNETESIYY